MGNLGSEAFVCGFIPINDVEVETPVDGLPVSGWIADELWCGISPLSLHIKVNMYHEHSLVVSGFDQALVVLWVPVLAFLVVLDVVAGIRISPIALLVELEAIECGLCSID